MPHGSGKEAGVKKTEQSGLLRDRQPTATDIQPNWCVPQSKQHAACCCFLWVAGGALGLWGVNELTGLCFGQVCLPWKISVGAGGGSGGFMGSKDCCIWFGPQCCRPQQNTASQQTANGMAMQKA
jgi:hypothetical protein